MPTILQRRSVSPTRRLILLGLLLVLFGLLLALLGSDNLPRVRSTLADIAPAATTLHPSDPCLARDAIALSGHHPSHPIPLAPHQKWPLTARQRVELRASSRVSGTIRTPRLLIWEGALFTGRHEMAAPARS